METALLIAAIQAAAQLVPSLLATANTAAPALNNTQPITASEGAQIVSDVEVAAATVPALLPLVPLVQKALAGTPFNDTDLATLKTAADAIDAQVAAAAAPAEADAPAS